MISLSVVMSTLISALVQSVVVVNAVRVLDHAVSRMLIHLAVVSLYDSVPRAWQWWFIHVVVWMLPEYNLSSMFHSFSL